MCVRGRVKAFFQCVPGFWVISFPVVWGEKRGSTNTYIYISVLVGFPVVFSTLVVVVLGDLAEGKSTSFCKKTNVFFVKYLVVVVL